MRKRLTLGVLISTSIAARAEQPAQRHEADRPGEIRAAAPIELIFTQFHFV